MKFLIAISIVLSQIVFASSEVTADNITVENIYHGRYARSVLENQIFGKKDYENINRLLGEGLLLDRHWSGTSPQARIVNLVGRDILIKKGDCEDEWDWDCSTHDEFKEFTEDDAIELLKYLDSKIDYSLTNNENGFDYVIRRVVQLNKLKIFRYLVHEKGIDHRKFDRLGDRHPLFYWSPYMRNCSIDVLNEVLTIENIGPNCDMYSSVSTSCWEEGGMEKYFQSFGFDETSCYK